MSEPEPYSVETELEEAEARARELPDQIARLRAEVRKARNFLTGESAPSDDLGEH